MNANKNLRYFEEENRKYFSDLEQNKERIDTAYQYIIGRVDSALSTGDIASLFSLISYIESGEGSVTLPHISKVHDIVRIIHIIRIESSNQVKESDLFCAGCKNFSQLYEKYCLTLFALRRLWFRLSEPSMNEAVDYLRDYHISDFAVFALGMDVLKLKESEVRELGNCC